MNSIFIMLSLTFTFLVFSHENSVEDSTINDLELSGAKLTIKKSIDISDCEVENNGYVTSSRIIDLNTENFRDPERSRGDRYKTNLYFYNGVVSCTPPIFQKYCELSVKSFKKENLKVKPCTYPIEGSSVSSMYVKSYSSLYPVPKDGRCIDIDNITCHENILYRMNGDELKYKSIKYQFGDYISIDGPIALKTNNAKIVDDEGKSNSIPFPSKTQKTMSSKVLKN